MQTFSDYNSSLNINSYIQKRKMALARSRKCISQIHWYKYLEKNYPDWWESVYGNKWLVRIDFTDIFGTAFKEEFHIYYLYVNKNSTMQEIVATFSKMIKNKNNSLKMCFGEDILSNILKHCTIPNTFDPNDYFVYVHKTMINHGSNAELPKVYKARQRIEDNMKLNRLAGQLVGQDEHNLYIHLRIRNKMNIGTISNFSGKYHFVE